MSQNSAVNFFLKQVLNSRKHPTETCSFNPPHVLQNLHPTTLWFQSKNQEAHPNIQLAQLLAPLSFVAST